MANIRLPTSAVNGADDNDDYNSINNYNNMIETS